MNAIEFPRVILPSVVSVPGTPLGYAVGDVRVAPTIRPEPAASSVKLPFVSAKRTTDGTKNV